MQYVTFSYASSIWLKVMLKWKLQNLKASIKAYFYKVSEDKAHVKGTHFKIWYERDAVIRIEHFWLNI